MPKNVRACTYRNLDRDAIHTTTFTKLLQTHPNDCLVILSSNLMAKGDKNQPYQPLKNKSIFYFQSTESHCKFSNSSFRMDPALKVWYDCLMMMTENKDVASGKSNGTQLILKRLCSNIINKFVAPI